MLILVTRNRLEPLVFRKRMSCLGRRKIDGFVRYKKALVLTAVSNAHGAAINLSMLVTMLANYIDDYLIRPTKTKPLD